MRKIIFYALGLLLAGVPLLFSVYFNNVFLDIKLFYFRTLLLLICLIWVICKITEKEIKLYNPCIYGGLIFFLFFSSLSYFFSFHRGMNYVAGPGYFHIIFLLIFFFISLDSSVYYGKNHINTIIIVSSFISLYGIFQWFGVDYFSWIQYSPNFESISTIGNSNLLGLYLNAVFPLSFASIFAVKGWKKVLYILSALSIILCLYFTYSRGAILSFLISLPLWFLFLGKNSKKLFTFFFIICFFFTVFLFVYKDTPEVKKFTEVEPVQVRVFLWGAAIKLIKEHPLIGSGFDTFKYDYLKYRFNEPSVNRNRLASAENSHNEFLDIAVATGIPGFLSFIFVLYVILSGGYKTLPLLSEKDRYILIGPLMGVIVFMINLNTVFSEVSSQVIFWYLLSFIAAMEIKYENSHFRRFSFPEERIAKGAVIFISIIVFCIIQWSNISMIMGSYYMDREKDVRDNNNLKESVECISKALGYEPDNGAYWLLMGKTCEDLVKAGNKEMFDSAEMSYEMAIKLNPLNSYNYADLGRLYGSVSPSGDEGMMNKALEKYKEAVRLDPYNIFFINDLGITFANKGDYLSAIDCYKRSIGIFDKGITRNLLGSALLRMGKLKEAHGELKKSIELEPELADPYFNLGMLYIKINDYERAYEMLDRAFYLSPERPDVAYLWLQVVRKIDEMKSE